MTPRHSLLDLSNKERVFTVGDIHGEYDLLEEELTKVGFNEHRDVLISVGDLADRGPYSLRALDYIQKAWFLRVLGNHELLPRYVLNQQVSRYDAETRWGGGWFTPLSDSDILTIAVKFEQAPFAMTVITPGKRRVGFVHADCMCNWKDHIEFLDKMWVQDLSTMSRETIKRILDTQLSGEVLNDHTVRVKHIDHVFHGHSVLPEVLTFTNRTWIDTGACFGEKLTLLDVDAFLNTL